MDSSLCAFGVNAQFASLIYKEAVPIFANHTYKQIYYHICEKIGINLAYTVTQNIQANSNDGSN